MSETGVKVSALPALPSQPTGTEPAVLVRNGVTYQAPSSYLDNLAPSIPYAGTLTGDEIVGLEQVDSRVLATLNDQARLFAAKRAGLLFNSIAQAISLVGSLGLQVGDMIATSDYATPGDGGGASYEQVAVEPTEGFQDTAGRWWALRATIFRPAMFGAFGDNGLDETAAIQRMFDVAPAGSAFEFRDGAEYLATNLSLPGGSKPSTIFAANRATIKAVAGGNPQYLIATKAFINNASFASAPIKAENIRFDGNNIVDYSVALTTYYGRFINCQFAGGLVASSYLTEKTSDGVTNAPSVVDNIFTNCMWSGSLGDGFRNSNNAQDFQIIGGQCFNNGGIGFNIQQSAGLIMLGVQLYSNTLGAAKFYNFGFQTQVVGNNFDGDVTIQTMSPSVDNAVLGSNTFKDGNLICNLGGANATATLIVDAPHFMGSARLLHIYDAIGRRVIVQGGTSEAEGPFIWDSTSPTGTIIANQHYNVACGGFLDGLMDIRSSTFVGGRAPNELALRKNLNASTSTSVAVQVVLPTSQLASSDVVVDLIISTLENGFNNVRKARFCVYAGIARKSAAATWGTYANVQENGSSTSSGISAVASWSISGGSGIITAILTMVITHAVPNTGTMLVKVQGDHRFATAMTLV